MRLAAAFVIIIAALLSLPCNLNASRGGGFDFPPPPTLEYPNTQKVDLSGKAYLEFKWHAGHLGETNGFKFRLYKGTGARENTAMIKENLPFDSNSYKVDAARFEDGQIYTWVLKQSYTERGNSDPCELTFSVIKK